MINTKFNLYKAEWLDLVFADRNKNYGAYDLRIHYGANMMRALAITVIGFTVAAVSMNIILKHNKPDDTITTIVELPNRHIKLPDIDKPKEAKLKKQHTNATKSQPAAAPKNNAAMQRVVPPVVTPDELVKTEPPKYDPSKAIGSVDTKGVIGKPVDNVIAPGGTGDGPGSGIGQGGDNINEVFDTGGLDIMPEPYGGAAAWAKFLQKNLRYPDTELQGRVVISFIIERDGKLTDLNIVKGVDNLLDREALRVLKLAPAWKPGQQNGKPVRVKYTIPIVFQMNEQ